LSKTLTVKNLEFHKKASGEVLKILGGKVWQCRRLIAQWIWGITEMGIQRHLGLADAS